MVEQIFPAACGGLMLQQRKIVSRTKELPSASPKGQSATSGGYKDRRRGSPGNHGGKVFFLSV